jgi:integrase
MPPADRKRMTDKSIQALKQPARGRLTVPDTKEKLLWLRVTEKGVKSWLIRYRVKGARAADGRPAPQRYFVPGTYPDVTLEEAREAAREIRAAAKKGVDLIEQRKREVEEAQKAASSGRTVRDLAADYVEKFCKIHHRQWVDAERRLKNHVLPTIGDRPAKDITKADVAALLNVLEHDKGLRHQVNRTRTTLSGMFRYAREEAVWGVTSNPVLETRRRKFEDERDRTLTDDELKAIWRALDALPEPGGSFTRMLLLTGARRDEVRHMAWRELSADGTTWTIPAARAKNGEAQEVPLSTQARTLLATVTRTDPLVFGIGEKAWCSHAWFKTRLDDASGVKGWRFHDIRRTIRSRLAELQVPFEVAERVLGHRMTKIERVYNRHSYRAEKAGALQKWADELDLIVSPNVVRLRASA